MPLLRIVIVCLAAAATAGCASKKAAEAGGSPASQPSSQPSGQEAAPASSQPSAPSSQPREAAAPAEKVYAKPGEAQVGDWQKCPVAGHEFQVTAESPKVEYKGKTYYMCCEDCIDEFKADPEKFIGSKDG